MNVQSQPHRGGVLRVCLVVFAVVCLLMVLLWVFMLPTLFCRSIRSRTGFEAKVETLSINPFTAKVEVTGLEIRNPPNFPVSDFITIRALRLDTTLGSLLGGKLLVEDGAIDIASVSLIRDQRGLTNAHVFQKALLGEENTPPTTTEPEPRPTKTPSANKEFLIRSLLMRFDKMTVADYSGSKPVIRNYTFNINHTYKDVSKPEQFAEPFVRSMAGMMMQRLLMPDSSAEQNSLKFNPFPGDKSGESVNSLIDSLEKTLKK